MRLDIGEGDLDRGELVAADAAAKNLRSARLGVELPRPILAYERNGEGPINVANVSGDEVFPRGFIRDLIARVSDIATALTKDGEDSALVFCFRGPDKRIDRVVRTLELFLGECRRAPTKNGRAKEGPA